VALLQDMVTDQKTASCHIFCTAYEYVPSNRLNTLTQGEYVVQLKVIVASVIGLTPSLTLNNSVYTAGLNDNETPVTTSAQDTETDQFKTGIYDCLWI